MWLRLFYVAAFLTEPDEHSFMILADHQAELLDALVVTDTGVGIDAALSREIFLGDQTDDSAAQLAAQLRSMPLNGADMSYVAEPAWKSVSSTYVLCTEDRAIPLAAQSFMAARVGKIVEWPTDHRPFLSRPRELAALLVSDRP
jgi:hypothetical protein